VKTKLLGTFAKEPNLLFLISLFIVFDTFIHVILAVFQESVEQTRQLPRHRRDGFRCSQASTQAAVLCASR